MASFNSSSEFVRQIFTFSVPVFEKLKANRLHLAVQKTVAEVCRTLADLSCLDKL
jgi:hypothetical protein